MTRKLSLLLAILLAAGSAGDLKSARWAGPLKAQAQSSLPQFTTAGLKGICGFTAAFMNVNEASADFQLPGASIGTLVFNGSGTVTATRIANAYGAFVPSTTMVGSYAVRADGRTGTMDFTASHGDFLQFEINSAGTGVPVEIHYINTGPVDSVSGIIDVVTAAVCTF